MTADGSAGSPLAERLVVTVGFGPIGSVVMIADGPVSSPLDERLVVTVVTVCFRHRWCLLTTVFLTFMLSASRFARFASKVCYTIKYDVNISYAHMICTYYMNMSDVHTLILGGPFHVNGRLFINGIRSSSLPEEDDEDIHVRETKPTLQVGWDRL